MPPAVVPGFQAMQNTPKQEAKLSWTVLRKTGWCGHNILRKMASGREGSVGTTDPKCNEKLIAEKWQYSGFCFTKNSRRLKGMWVNINYTDFRLTVPSHHFPCKLRMPSLVETPYDMSSGRTCFFISLIWWGLSLCSFQRLQFWLKLEIPRKDQGSPLGVCRS